MLEIDHVVDVIAEKCIGCKQCDMVCPTEAIKTIDKLARVDKDLCTGCNRCLEACMDHGAIVREFLPAPRLIKTTLDDLNPAQREQAEKLCADAQYNPSHSLCVCTATTAGEVAAALVLGHHTPEELCTATGVRGVCAMWCSSAVMRLMDVAGIKIERPERDWRIYTEHTGQEVGLWSITPQVAAKYPEYRIEKYQQRLEEKGRLTIPCFPDILRRPS